MESYTEDQIREAFAIANRKLGYAGITRLSLEEILWQLARGSDMHAIWADSDTVTVKELRETWERLFPGMYPLQLPQAEKKATLDAFLEDISGHREPEYPYQSAWKDRDEVVWQRTAKKMWRKMGEPGEFSHGYPKRPLKRMGVV